MNIEHPSNTRHRRPTPHSTCTTDAGAVKLITEGTVLALADALAVLAVLIRGTRPLAEPARPAGLALTFAAPRVTPGDRIRKHESHKVWDSNCG